MNDFFFVQAKDGPTDLYLVGMGPNAYMNINFDKCAHFESVDEAQLALDMIKRKCPLIKRFSIMKAGIRKWNRG